MGEWEQLLMAVDSGATGTVVSENNATTIPTMATKSGIKYALANGETIENEGEKQMVINSEEGVEKLMTVQVTDVAKPLMSVSRLVNNGKTVVFEKGNSFIYDQANGETMYMEERKGLFMLKLYVKPSGF